MVASGTRLYFHGLTVGCFNPLHCGAVVASLDAAARIALAKQVSIPFIAGQWSLLAVWRAWAEATARVSIPFIAGQWSLRTPPAAWRRGKEDMFQSPSLRGSGRFHTHEWTRYQNEDHKFQSPSLRGSGRFARPRRSRRWSASSFNPLHCGAVVASSSPWRSWRWRSPVSIPFIAGQWSLH